MGIINGYIITSEKEMMKLDHIQKLLEQTYWAKGRTIDIIEKSINNSIAYGIFYGEEQVGYARAVTDYSTMFWIADVIIDKEHRGKGLGKELIKIITEDERLKGLLGVLSTEDAHSLYEQYGFNMNTNFMKKPRIK